MLLLDKLTDDFLDILEDHRTIAQDLWDNYLTFFEAYLRDFYYDEGLSFYQDMIRTVVLKAYGDDEHLNVLDYDVTTSRLKSYNECLSQTSVLDIYERLTRSFHDVLELLSQAGYYVEGAKIESYHVILDTERYIDD